MEEFKGKFFKVVLPGGESLKDRSYPWDDVNECMGNRLDAYEYRHRKSCYKCGLEANKLIWIMFKSPPETWRMLMGREGPLSICPHCNVQVEFICEVMN